MVDAVNEIVGMVAVSVLGPLVGSEFAVAAFLHPILGRLPDEAFRGARSESARLLGRVMPFWYLTALALLVVAAVVGSQPWLIGAGAGLLVLVVLMTVTMMVPINNRIAAGEVSAPLVARWDRLHWLRVVLLAAGFVLSVVGVVHG